MDIPEVQQRIEDYPEPKKPIPRLTIVETLYHRTIESGIAEYVGRFTRDLQSDDEPYQRQKKIGEEWEPLDTGWLEVNVGTVFIQNKAGTDLMRVPSDGEKEAISRQAIVIRFNGSDGLIIPPKESARFCPVNSSTIEICSLSGTIRYSLCVVPR